jgi:PadR family transcriptional regulator PadR
MTDSIQVQLKKGALDLCVLALLSRGENYAYDIASTLVATLGMGEGTIYPLMRRLQNDGLVATRLVESNSGPPRKYYRLTPAGRATYETHRRDWRSFIDAVEQILGDRT